MDSKKERLEGGFIAAKYVLNDLAEKSIEFSRVRFDEFHILDGAARDALRKLSDGWYAFCRARDENKAACQSSNQSDERQDGKDFVDEFPDMKLSKFTDFSHKALIRDKLLFAGLFKTFKLLSKYDEEAADECTHVNELYRLCIEHLLRDFGSVKPTPSRDSNKTACQSSDRSDEQQDGKTWAYAHGFEKKEGGDG